MLKTEDLVSRPDFLEPWGVYVNLLQDPVIP